MLLMIVLLKKVMMMIILMMLMLTTNTYRHTRGLYCTEGGRGRVHNKCTRENAGSRNARIAHEEGEGEGHDFMLDTASTTAVLLLLTPPPLV